MGHNSVADNTGLSSFV